MKLRLLLPLGCLTTVLIAWTVLPPAAGFPHEKHSKLFTSCASCHAGITTGSPSRRYPTQRECVQCHNGEDVKAVAWTSATPVVSNLKFSHDAHADASARAGRPATCVSCHAAAGDTTWMHVGRAEPGRCMSCHQQREHLAADAPCATCHVPLTAAKTLPDSVVASFPKPSSHDGRGFLLAHGAAAANNSASCATCHARESCARCHPNASRLPAIAQLAPDGRVARLVATIAPAYPVPASHDSTAWKFGHGSQAAAGAAGCANCHTQRSCTTCHAGSTTNSTILSLPVADGHAAPGVRLGKETPRATMHAADFLRTHPSAAASGALNCQSCHQTRECTSCHAGTAPVRTYHAADFVSRHGTAAFRQSADCSSCHRTETFCRSCHQSQGIASTGNVRGAAHTSQPLWLLQHSQAARQGLTGCTSCHQQRDCLRCHSTTSQSVNPHGATFDARAAEKKNAQTCLVCHVRDPLKP